MAASGIHHANTLVRGLRSQSRAMWTVSFAIRVYPAQQEAGPVSPARSAWTGGHGTDP